VTAAAPSSPTPTRNAREELLERLSMPDAVLWRTDLAALGLGRRAVDAVFRALPTIVLPGFSRPCIRVGDYLELVERCTSHERCEPAEPTRVVIAREAVRPPVLPAELCAASLSEGSGSTRPSDAREAS
jgi:hypothetical protein